MDYKEILGILITIGVFIGLALVGVLVRYICKKLSQQTDNEFFQGFLEELSTLSAKAVDYVNQTYVNALKEQGKFDLDAQKQAFQTAFDAVIGSLSSDALKYINSGDSDPVDFITMFIECAVSEAKRWGSGVTKEEKDQKSTEFVQGVIAEDKEPKEPTDHKYEYEDWVSQDDEFLAKYR